MKKPILASTLTSTLVLTLFFLSSHVANAQQYCEWTEPVLLTDTNSVYANPAVGVYRGSSWMFYEKQEETTSIYKMDLNDASDNVVLLSSATVNYTEPFFYPSENTERSGYLFYLSDEEGEVNLFASVLFENDSLGLPIKIIENPENLSLMDYSLGQEYNFFSYTLDSTIVVANIVFPFDSVYIKDVVVLDSSGFNVQRRYNSALWQEIVDDSSFIKKSVFSYNPDSGFSYWSEPVFVDSIGNNQWLVAGRHSQSWFGEDFHFWERNDTVFAFNYYQGVFTMNTNLKPDVRHISEINWGMGVKKEMWDFSYLCFTTGLGDSSEIFVSAEFCSEDDNYISNNNYPDDNPEVFFGEFKDVRAEVYYVYCIWQSHINGNTALSMSKSVAEFYGSIEEQSVTDNYLKVSPNPFHDNLQIDVNTYGKKAQLKTLNIRGQQIKKTIDLSPQPDWQTVSWQAGSNLPKGVYLVVLSTGGREYVRKVVLQ